MLMGSAARFFQSVSGLGELFLQAFDFCDLLLRARFRLFECAVLFGQPGSQVFNLCGGLTCSRFRLFQRCGFLLKLAGKPVDLSGLFLAACLRLGQSAALVGQVLFQGTDPSAHIFKLTCGKVGVQIKIAPIRIMGVLGAQKESVFKCPIAQLTISRCAVEHRFGPAVDEKTVDITQIAFGFPGLKYGALGTRCLDMQVKGALERAHFFEQ